MQWYKRYVCSRRYFYYGNTPGHFRDGTLGERKEAERRLAELNDTLRKEKIEQEDYYRELLEMQSCGVLAYTIPGHKIIHMNAQALRMYGVENIEEAQSKLGTMLKK